MSHLAGLEYEHHYWDQNQLVVGIDEAGRGPIAGPLVVAGVVFDIGYQNSDIYDSKALSEKKRKQLFLQIIQDAKAYQIKIVSPQIVDQQNIYRATQEAMNQIACTICCDAVLTDAMPLPNCPKAVMSIIKGDQKSLSIAAGSILAKVVRDHIMMGYDHLYPEYGFAQHKGYPTKGHLEKLEQYGVLDFYRKSYGPVARLSQLSFQLDESESF